MGNWIFKWWRRITLMLIQYSRLRVSPWPTCNVEGHQRGRGQTCRGSCLLAFPKKRGQNKQRKASDRTQLRELRWRNRTVEWLLLVLLMPQRKKRPLPNTRHLTAFLISASQTLSSPSSLDGMPTWEKYPAFKNLTWSHRIYTSGMFQNIRRLGVSYTLFALNLIWGFSTNRLHTILPLRGEDKSSPLAITVSSLRAETMF